MSSFKLPGTDKREENRRMRENLTQADSNDMMSLKAMFMFLNEISSTNSKTFSEFKDEKAMNELIKTTKNEFAISPENASNFIKSDKFKELNKNLITPFKDDDIEIMSNEILKKVGNTEFEKILGVKGYLVDKFKDLALETIKENMKGKNDEKNYDTVKDIIKEKVDVSSDVAKIQRNINRK